jgi:hypothetical protein
VLILAGAPAAWAAEAAAKVVMLTGKATAVGSDGTVRPLAKDDPVYSGDLINSGPSSYINLRFADGGFFLLRPGTRFAIEDYRYAGAPAAAAAAPAPAKPAAGAAAPVTPPPLVAAASGEAGQSRAFFRLVKGGFRAVSGLIGKVNQNDYRVSTPVATIGIRGTAYSARLCQGDCGDRDEIMSKLRSAGRNAKAGETILVTTVEQGAIAIETKTAADVQLPGTTRLVGEDGSVTPTDTPPSTEQKDQDLKPESCGA